MIKMLTLKNNYKLMYSEMSQLSDIDENLTENTL